MSDARINDGSTFDHHNTAAVQHAAVLCMRASSRRRRSPGAAPLLITAARRFVARFLPIIFMLLALHAPAQTLPGTTVTNVAQLEFGEPDGRLQQDSNSVAIVTRPPSSQARIDLIKITPGGSDVAPIGATTCRNAGGVNVSLDLPTLLDGSQVDTQTPQSLAPGTLYHANEPVFIRVDDADQNIDGRARDTLTVSVSAQASNDAETVTLTETGDNTGVFTGYVPTSAAAMSAGDCALQLRAGDEITVRYQDPSDNTDVSAAAALVDPLGIVFDSSSGAPIDDVLVTLINVDTGQPATVVGDDGVSAYPSTVTTGGRVTDGGGTIYQFADGQFRFPLIAPGTYRLDVVPPANYRGPSQVTPAALQAIPGAPFAIEAGSFGGTFEVVPGPVINIDIPLDPRSVDLFLQKTVSAATASPGDFLAYTLTLENANGSAPATALEIEDRLPAGFRLVADSVTINDVAAGDPTFGASAADLRFALPDLAPGARTVVRYVVEVTGAAAGEEAVNVATARSGNDLLSNTARASVRLFDDLFAQRTFLIGRVLDGQCGDVVNDEAQGVKDVRIYLEDGRYAVTDETGRYHFEGLRAGAHVVQLDTDSVPREMEIVPCLREGFFTGRAYSQFVDLDEGTLWRADFYLRPIPPPTGSVVLALNATPHDAADEAHYSLRVHGAIVPVSGLKARVMLPPGLDLRAGSVRVDGAVAADPLINGSTLTFELGQKSGQWQQQIEFDAVIAPSALGDLTTKAVATFATLTDARQRTPLAQTQFVRLPPKAQRIERVLTPQFGTRKAVLTDADQQSIDAAIAEFSVVNNVQLRVIGHTDNRRIAMRNRAEFASNDVLSRARAQSVAQYIARALSLPPSQVSFDGAGARQPVADNTTADGRARNRRVEVMLFGDQIVAAGKLDVVTPNSGEQAVKTQGQRAGSSTTELAPEVAVDWFASNDWLDEASAEFALLEPSLDANPAIGSLKVVVKHGGREQVALALNGEPVSALNFDGVTRSADQRIGVSRWRGVDIRPGNNTLNLSLLDANGQVIQTQSRSVHFAGGPVRGDVIQSDSTLIADGRTVPVITLALFDRDGQRARPDSVGVYQVDPPYRSLWQVNAERDNALIVVGDRDPVYSIDARGHARIELEPTSEAGEVTLRLRFENGREQEVRTWLKPAARDWILVALAEGTAGLNKISDNDMEALAAGVDDNYYQDGRVAFFAKGRIRGDRLVTIAYDSDGDEADARERLFGQIDPDRFYTLYGDATDQRFDAASAEKLFLKIERNRFYALLGDYETGLDVTELSRYTRSFNGLKSEWQGARLGFTAFAAQTDQAFIKDELRGDGTSGLYRLSRTPLIVNSEKVTLEVRDRFRSERVLEARPLARHLDYDIDYLNGTLFFKQPVQTRDQDLNPIYIVADYEARDARGEALTAGGRASLKLGERLTLGVSALREGVEGGEGDLYGADLRFDISDVTELRAEFATSETRQNGLTSAGDGYLVEVRHQGARMDGTAYVREQEGGFGLGQQRATESGTRKAGLDGRLRLSKTLTLETQMFRQQALATDDVRDVAQVAVRYQSGRGSVAAGLRYANDDVADQTDLRSRQAFVQTSVNAFGDRVTLRASHDADLDAGAGNSDYPARTTVGADVKISDKASVFVEHEMANGERLETDTTRVGVRATPWERARINASVNRNASEYGPRMFANVGLIQGWQLSERWTLDVGLDHSNTIADPELPRALDAPPLTSGETGTDFTSAFIGALYRAENWSATSRFESRRSDDEQRDSLIFGLYREETQGVGFSADAQVFDSQRQTGSDVLDAQLRLGWVWRPDGSRWTVLNRLDSIYNNVDAGNGDLRTWKLINNFAANYVTGRGSQLSLRYGAKYVRSAVGDQQYTGFSDLIGAQWRRPLGERLDIGVHGNVRHAWRSDVYDYSLGLEAGVSPATNLWLGVGYNVVGFEDDDFAASGYVAQGPYLRFRLKADTETFAGVRRRMPFVSRKTPAR